MNAANPSTAGWCAETWSEALALRIWCDGIAGFLEQLGTWLGCEPGTFPPPEPVRFATFRNAAKGVDVQLHYPFWDRTSVADRERWVISQLDFLADRAPLPFDLDAAFETEESAAAKLSNDFASFPERRMTTYYLHDGRVAAIEFKAGGTGIVLVRMTRLGGAVPFEP